MDSFLGNSQSIILLSISNCANLDKPQLSPFSNNGVRFTKPLKTWNDFLKQHIIMQRFDYSCGAASLATLMRYYFQDNVTEGEVLEDILNSLSEAEIANRRKEGFSMLDLKQFAERRGYQAIGLKLEFSALSKLRGPILVYLETTEYKHFAVLRGIKEDRVFLADPGRGNLRLSIEHFQQEWTGISLVLIKKGFGTPSKYPLAIQEKLPLRHELNTVRQGLYLQIW